MNIKMIIKTLGRLLKLTSLLLLFPLVVALIYQEGDYLSYVIPILLSLILGVLFDLIKQNNNHFFAKEGFIIVGLSWIIMSLIGCLPIFLRGEATFIDAFFETVSGLTTTGASALENVEACSKGVLFWRSFTHWIGGMGILVFMLSIIPTSDAQNIFLLRAESPGPQVGKLVSKVKDTTRILYGLYFLLTFLEFLFLLFGGMSVFDSICNAMATAGTGGFGLYADSIAHYNIYSQVVITVFMLLFGVNFNIYYLVVVGKIKDAIKSEELRWYFGIVSLAILLITVNLTLTKTLEYTIPLALKDSAFQVASIITTTGFATTDFNLWPEFSKTILVILMFIGASAGSTGGGLKVSRFVLLLKDTRRNIRKMIHPSSVSYVSFEGQIVDENTISGVTSYFFVLMAIVFVSTIIVSTDAYSNSFTTSFTSVVACVNNIGPGLELVGPFGGYHGFSWYSKLVLIFDMLLGRLEIYPIILLFSINVWKDR